MFGFHKSLHSTPKTRDLINFFGYVLQSRGTILNYGQIARNNIFTGKVIGAAFAKDKGKLDDEFNALALYMVMRAYIECGVSKEQLDGALGRLFDEFLADDVFADRSERDKIYALMEKRVEKYLAAEGNVQLAEQVLAYIATDNLSSQEAGSASLFAGQIAERYDEILTNVRRELRY